MIIYLSEGINHRTFSNSSFGGGDVDLTDNFIEMYSGLSTVFSIPQWHKWHLVVTLEAKIERGSERVRDRERPTRQAAQEEIEIRCLHTEN